MFLACTSLQHFKTKKVCAYNINLTSVDVIVHVPKLADTRLLFIQDVHGETNLCLMQELLRGDLCFLMHHHFSHRHVRVLLLRLLYSLSKSLESREDSI